MDANVQALVTNLSNGEADLVECARIYNDVLTRLATIPILAQFTPTIAPVSGTVAVPGISLLLAFYENVQLGELSVREANWVLPNWREAVGTPVAFVRESVPEVQLQLVPAPNDGGNAQILSTYGTDTLPIWLQLPVALLVLADEYQRESDHQKIEVSEAAGALGQFLIQLLLKR